MAHYVLLNDPVSHVQHLICFEHISAAEIRKEDQIVKLYLAGGQELILTHEESKQFLHNVQGKIQASQATQAH